jgi:hypothetical protein
LAGLKKDYAGSKPFLQSIEKPTMKNINACKSPAITLIVLVLLVWYLQARGTVIRRGKKHNEPKYFSAKSMLINTDSGSELLFFRGWVAFYPQPLLRNLYAFIFRHFPLPLRLQNRKVFSSYLNI